jgi:hypothetical protein
MPEIIYQSNCELCEEHKTELGVLVSITKSIKEQFPDLSEESQVILIKSMYEQWKLDERTRMIQGFKTKNIKSINQRE